MPSHQSLVETFTSLRERSKSLFENILPVTPFYARIWTPPRRSSPSKLFRINILEKVIRKKFEEPELRQNQVRVYRTRKKSLQANSRPQELKRRSIFNVLAARVKLVPFPVLLRFMQLIPVETREASRDPSTAVDLCAGGAKINPCSG